jgi:hypothetical protein
VDAEYRIYFTKEIHLGPKPLACSIARIALYSTLSKTFSKSIFRIIMGFLKGDRCADIQKPRQCSPEYFLF